MGEDKQKIQELHAYIPPGPHDAVDGLSRITTTHPTHAGVGSQAIVDRSCGRADAAAGQFPGRFLKTVPAKFWEVGVWLGIVRDMKYD